MQHRRKVPPSLAFQRSRLIARTSTVHWVPIQFSGRELRAWRFRHGPACVPTSRDIAEWVSALVRRELARIPGAMEVSA